MTEKTLETEARAFLDAHQNSEDYSSDFRKLPDELAEVVARLELEGERKEIEAMFTPERAGKSWEVLSPSGKYRLVVTTYTGTGDFHYTRGVVSCRKGEGWVELPQDIKRNYPSFPYSWIEDHANGHSYLVGGIDYQGQTVLELDTGRRHDFIPKEATLGWGFCWVTHQYDAEHQLLIVEGCYWACPEEIRLYDFSSPMDGWPWLEMLEDGERTYQSPYGKPPEITAGSVKFYQLEGDEVCAVKTFKRDGHKLIFTEEWVSEAEREVRRKRAESEARHEAWWANFKATDPLYVEMKKLGEGLPGDDHCGIGVCHDRWCPFYRNTAESRICRRVVATKDLDVNLEWGADKGPILVHVQRAGSTPVAQWFDDHSVEGMRKAFACVRAAMGSADG